MKYKQYSIHYINLDPTIGKEIKKQRPCIILTPTSINNILKTMIIAPITSKKRNIPTRLEINTQNIQGWIALDQIRTIDEKRINNEVELINDKEIIKNLKIILAGLLDIDINI